MFTIRSDMPAAAPAPDPVEDADPAAARERALLDRQLKALDRLAALGMDMAETIARRVTSDDGSAPASDLRHAAIDFSRVARAVRLTFALQSKLIADFKARARPAEAARSEPGILEVRWADDRKRAPGEPLPLPNRLKGAVRRAAEAANCDVETTERLVREAAERLGDDDIHAAVMTRPFDEIVAMICKELGLEQAPFPLDGRVRAFAEGERSNGDGGDLSAAPQLNRHLHSRPLPHQGAEEIVRRSP